MKNKMSNWAQLISIFIVGLLFIHVPVVANAAEDKFTMSGDFRLRAESDTNPPGF